MKKERNVSGIILAVLCFLLAVYFGQMGINNIRFTPPVSRFVITSVLVAGLFIFLGVLALLRSKRVLLIIWTALNIFFGFYGSVIAVMMVLNGEAIMPYRFLGLRPVEWWLHFEGAPGAFVITLIPMLIFLVLAICSHDRKTGKGRTFAKILCWVPGVVNAAVAALIVYIIFFAKSISSSVLASIYGAHPMALLIYGGRRAQGIITIAYLIFVAKDFLLGFWIAFPDRTPAVTEGAPVQEDFAYVPDESGRFGFCPVCGAPLPEGAVFCTVCGGATDAPGSYCPSCGQKNVSGGSFCENCGGFMKTEAPQEDPDQQFSVETAPTVIFAESKPSEEAATEMFFSDIPSGRFDSPMAEPVAGGAFAEPLSADEIPADLLTAVPMDEAPVEEVPAEVPPVEEASAEMPVELEPPVAEAPAPEPPVAEPPAAAEPEVPAWAFGGAAVPPAEPVPEPVPTYETAKPVPEPVPVPSPAREPVKGITCTNCGADLTPGSAFCRHCGSRVEPAKPEQRFCAACGRPLKPGVAFCTSCGAKVGD